MSGPSEQLHVHVHIRFSKMSKYLEKFSKNSEKFTESNEGFRKAASLLYSYI